MATGDVRTGMTEFIQTFGRVDSLSMSIEKRELQSLPWRYRVAFAARVARRVVPLFRHEHVTHRDVVHQAIGIAEQYASGSDQLAQYYANADNVAAGTASPEAIAGDKAVIAMSDALRNAEDAARRLIHEHNLTTPYPAVQAAAAAYAAAHTAALNDHQQHEGWAASITSFANEAAGAAETAVFEAAADPTQFVDEDTYRNACREDVYAFESSCERDYLCLQTLAADRKEKNTELGSPVDVSEFGDLGALWPEGSPRPDAL